MPSVRQKKETNGLNFVNLQSRYTRKNMINKLNTNLK